MARVMMVVCVVVACMVVAEAITCGQVVSRLAPCIGYLQHGGPVSFGCCSGVKGLNDAAKTTPDRQATCGCLKAVYASNTAINLNNANSLPAKCGVNIPYKLSPTTDCSKIQ